MTIEKHAPWGEAGALPAGGVVVRSDQEARQIVERARRANEAVPPLGLLGGDLCRAVGGTGDERRLHSDEAMRLPVDLGSVLIDGRLHWFVAHVVARKSWWRGPVFAAMNAEHIGSWDVAPRGHPNDGKLDCFAVTMTLSERLQARSRLVTGTHVPHPHIEYRQLNAIQWDVPNLDVWLDGERLGSARHLSVRLEPDALLVVV